MFSGVKKYAEFESELKIDKIRIIKNRLRGLWEYYRNISQKYNFWAKKLRGFRSPTKNFKNPNSENRIRGFLNNAKKCIKI